MSSIRGGSLQKPMAGSFFASVALENFSKSLPSSHAEAESSHFTSPRPQQDGDGAPPLLSLFEKIMQVEEEECKYFARCTASDQNATFIEPTSSSFRMETEATSEDGYRRTLLKEKEWQQRREALKYYHPLVNGSIFKRAAEQVRIEETLQYAKSLLQQLEENQYRNLNPLLRSVKQKYCSEMPSAGASTCGAPSHSEETSGILTRLKVSCSSSSRAYSSPRGRPQERRIHTTAPDTRSAHVNEIIPNGKVVTLTEPTLPHHVLAGASLRHVLDQQLLRQWKTRIRPTLSLPARTSDTGTSNAFKHEVDGGIVVRKVEGKECQQSHDAILCTLYIHLIVFRQGMSWRECSRSLVETTRHALEKGTQKDGNGERDVRVEMGALSFNLCLEDDVTSTQLCSLSIQIKKIPREGSTTEEEQERNASLLQERSVFEKGVLPHVEVLYQELSRLNLRFTNMALQLLGWRSFGCSLQHTSTCQKQYSLLFRHVHPVHHPRFLEGSVQRKSMAFPNFYAPDVFGPPDCVFRSYHILAAMETGRIREAILMTLCMVCWPMWEQGEALQKHLRLPTGNEVRTLFPTWLDRLATLLRSSETRPMYLRQGFANAIPSSLYLLIQRSKSYLLWNVLASCRIHAIRHPRSGAMMEEPCVVGDIVAPRAAHPMAAPTPASPAEEVVPGRQKLDSYGDRTCWHSTVSPQGLWRDAWMEVHDEPASTAPSSRGQNRKTMQDHDTVVSFSSPRPPSSDWGAADHAVYLLTSEEAAVAHSLMEVVIPLPYGTVWNDLDVFQELWEGLGFATAGARVYDATLEEGPPHLLPCRPLLRSCTGFPHASRPWVKVLESPLEASGSSSLQRSAMMEEHNKEEDLDETSTETQWGSTRWTTPAHRLSSDLECGESAKGRNFTSLSRGKRAAVRPLDRVGYRMVDRLPTGLLSASLTSSSAPSFRHSISPSSITKSVVFHGTIAGDTSISNLFREVWMIDP